MYQIALIYTIYFQNQKSPGANSLGPPDSSPSASTNCPTFSELARPLEGGGAGRREGRRRVGEISPPFLEVGACEGVRVCVCVSGRCQRTQVAAVSDGREPNAISVSFSLSYINLL